MFLLGVGMDVEELTRVGDIVSSSAAAADRERQLD